MVAVGSGGEERRVNPNRLEQTGEEGGLETSTLVPGRLGGTDIRDRSRRGTYVARRHGDENIFDCNNGDLGSVVRFTFAPSRDDFGLSFPLNLDASGAAAASSII